MMLPLLCYAATLALWAVSVFRLGYAGQRSAVLSPLNWWLIIAGLSLVPLYHSVGIAAFLRSITSEFSISLMLLLAASVLLNSPGLHRRLSAEVVTSLFESLQRQKVWLARALAVPGLVFYGMSLGVGSIDPYALGFGSFEFSSALLLLGLLCWQVRYYFLCLLLVAAQAAYAAGLLDSVNLWDYLLDPWLWGWSCYFVIAGRKSSASSINSRASA